MPLSGNVVLGDILANVPYDPRAGIWFDHHLLTASNEKPPSNFKGRHRIAPSAARLVYEYYLEKLPEVLERKIRSVPYSKAAVGACRANGASGFARYRIAVLFF